MFPFLPYGAVQNSTFTTNGKSHSEAYICLAQAVCIHEIPQAIKLMQCGFHEARQAFI